MSELQRRTPSPTNQNQAKLQVNCTVISAKINTDLLSGRKEHAWSVVFGPKKSQFQTQVSAEPSEPRWHDQATLKCHFSDQFQFKLKDRKQTVGKHETNVSLLPRSKNPVPLQLMSKQGCIGELTVSCWVTGYLPPSYGSQTSRTSDVITRLQSLPRKPVSMRRPSHLAADSGDSPRSPLTHSPALLTAAHSDSNLACKKRSAVVWDSRETMDSPLPHSSSNLIGCRADSSSSLSSCPDRSSVSSLTESLRSHPPYCTPNRVPTPQVRAVRPRTVYLDRNTRVSVTGEHLCQTQSDVLELKIGQISCTDYVETAGPSEIQLLIPALIYMPEHKGHIFLHTRQGTCEATSLSVSFKQGVKSDGMSVASSRHSVNSDTHDSPCSSTDDLKIKVSRSFQGTVPSSHLRYSTVAEQLMPPEVTGLGPRQATLQGGIQITLRGNYLGISREDVCRVGVAGTDCTPSLEYYSSYKIVVTCPAVAFPCSGPVVVETASGGLGISGMHFSFVDEETLGTKEYIAGKSPNRPSVRSKPPSHRDEQLSRQVQELQSSNSHYKLHIKEQGEEIRRLQEYIDRLVVRIMERNPELLMADN